MSALEPCRAVAETLSQLKSAGLIRAVWLPGMRAITGMAATRVCADNELAGTPIGALGAAAVPDIHDPTTTQCLGLLAREAWKALGGVLVISPVTRGGSGWVARVALDMDSKQRLSARAMVGWVRDAEADVVSFALTMALAESRQVNL